MKADAYREFVENAVWRDRPPLARVILGQRKAVHLSLTAVAAQLSDEVSASDVFGRLTRFEEGGLIDEELFEDVINLLQLDREALDELIEQHRADALREAEEWSFPARAMTLTICFSKNAGTRVSVPETVQTPREAEAWAASVARERGFRVILDVRRRVRLAFASDGSLQSLVRVDPPPSSGYPFAAVLEKHVQEKELDLPSRAAVRRAIKQLAMRLARAKGLDPKAWRHSMPTWYGEVPSPVAVLFQNARFWSEMAEREGSTLENLNDIFD